MTVEERLRGALADTAGYQPSPDLFAKVKGSIEDDRAHRRRLFGIAALVAGLTVAAFVWLAAWWNPQRGRAPLPWWSVVVVVVAVEIAIVALMRPGIRRFGRIYAADVFRTNRQTGARFLGLIDAAYYLVFAGYILATTPLRPMPVWRFALGFRELIQGGVGVIAGLLLTMGLLHALTIFTLPLTGLVFATIRHRLVVPDKAQWSPEVRRAHRTVTLVLVIAGIAGAIGVVWTFLAVAGLVAGITG